MSKLIFHIFYFILIPVICFAQKPVNQQFTIEKKINHTSVKDQYYSSTCWSFATLSFLESEMIRLGKGEMDLSEMFVARYSYLNKIKEYLKRGGDNYFTPGGQAHDVIKVMEENGIVPESVYSGLTKGQAKHWHAEMDTMINREVQRLLKQNVRELNAEQLAVFNQIFDECLGKIPEKFTFKGNIYTPKTFAQTFFGNYLNQYVNLTSYTHHTDYQAVILEDKFNWLHQKYYNLPLNEWKEVIDYALQNNFSVAWNGDVTEKTFDYTQGIAYLPNSLSKVNAQLRLQTFKDTSSKIDHLMHLIGIAKNTQDEKFYLIKNSWGDNTNIYKGYLYMSEPYLLLKTVSIMVPKTAIPAKIREKLKL